VTWHRWMSVQVGTAPLLSTRHSARKVSALSRGAGSAFCDGSLSKILPQDSRSVHTVIRGFGQSYSVSGCLHRHNSGLVAKERVIRTEPLTRSSATGQIAAMPLITGSRTRDNGQSLAARYPRGFTWSKIVLSCWNILSEDCMSAYIRSLLGCVSMLCVQCSSAQPRARDAFDSNGVRILYEVSGQGMPVILLHGFGESLEKWRETGVTKILEINFKVIAIDTRGHGGSDKPYGAGSYGTELASDIVRLMDHLHIDKAHIVGYSMGALIALDFALLHQQRAISVILVGAGWNPPEALDGFRRQAEAFENGKVPLRDIDDGRALASLLRGIRSLKEDDFRAVAIPIAAVIGSNDHFRRNVDRLARVLPTLEIVEVPGATHANILADAQFARSLLSLLRKQRIN
jgi:pimeloyl-ACP methyl ester carboxylesterase